MATTARQITRLTKTQAPRLPDAPVGYSAHYQDQYSNVLRLYFNQIDTDFGGLLTDAGGRFLNYPYAAVQRTTDKLFAANTATQITFDTNDYINACTNDGTDGIVVEYAGVYNYQFSVQFANTDSQIHTAYVWLRKNGVDLAGTGSKWDVPNKHGSSDGYLIAAANFFVELQAGDYVSMYAAVTQAYSPTTPSAGIYMEAYTSQTSPFAMPAIPSVVATLSFVSSVPT